MIKAGRLRWFSAAALLLSALMLGLSALAVTIGLSNLRISRALVTQTTRVQGLSAELQASLRAAETGQRGFLLTGLERYLRPYQRALTEIPRELATLAGAVRDAEQRDRLASLAPVVEAKLAELALTIRLRRTGLDAALAVVRTDKGQALSERIDGVLARFAEREQALLAARMAEEERDARRTAMAAALAGLLSLLSAAFGISFLYQQRAADRLIALNADLERQVEERTARLVDANQALDAYAYTISHDLRAPLRAIHGYAEALKEDESGRLSVASAGFIDALLAAAQRMNTLIDDILTYAKLARSEIELRPVSLDRLVARARQNVLEGEAVGTIEVRHPLGTVVGHPATLEQVITNLLSNALKFSAPGRAAQVEVHAGAIGGDVVLYVDDDGIGIAPRFRDKVFSPFSRLHGVESYAGTGIGLAIVKRGIERMGGRCGVADSPQGGSRFWFALAGRETAT